MSTRKFTYDPDTEPEGRVLEGIQYLLENTIRPTLVEDTHELQRVRLYYPQRYTMMAGLAIQWADMEPFKVVGVEYPGYIPAYALDTTLTNASFVDIIFAGPLTLGGMM